jgi:NADPH-dependent curcumin reductase CurA
MSITKWPKPGSKHVTLRQEMELSHHGEIIICGIAHISKYNKEEKKTKTTRIILRCSGV